jgi:hypothetical protein
MLLKEARRERRYENFFNFYALRKNICLSNCLFVVWKLSVPEYILTLKTRGTPLVLALVRRGYSHTLNPTNPKYFC